MKKKVVKRQIGKCGRIGGRTGRWTAAAGLLLAAVLCAGCGSAGYDSTSFDMNTATASQSAQSLNGFDSFGGASYESAPAEAGSFDMKGSAESGSVESADNGVVSDGQKLIRTVNLSVETKEFDKVISSLNTQIKQLGGYIESMETYNGSQYSSYRRERYASMTIRVPKTQLDGFLETVSGICNVVRQSESVDDVTLSYVDMESRRNTLRTEQERLLGFLEQAQSIEEIITIEDRLSNVRYQLESMESQLRTIDNQVDYSTVYLDISEVKELTPVVEQTVWERISSGFVESVRDVGDGAVELCIWFLVNIPYFIIWAAVITVVVLIIKKLRKNKKKKKDAAITEQVREKK